MYDVLEHRKVRRYNFLQQSDIFEALNRIRDAFLAAKDGREVDHIINGLLTQDERLRLGRRIQVAEWILAGSTTDDIERNLKVGRTTIVLVGRLLSEHPECFDLLGSRRKKVEKEFKNKTYRSTGGSKLWVKRKEYTGFTRKDVKR